MSEVIVEDGNQPQKHRVSDIDIRIGYKLQEFREMFDITQTELGNAIGVTFQQIQKYEKGINRIHAEVIWRIASIFGIEVDFFFPAEDSIFSTQEEDSLVFSINNIKYNDKDSIKLIKHYMSIKDLNIKRKITNLISSIVDLEDK